VREGIIAILALVAIGGIAHMTWEIYRWPCFLLKIWRNQRNGPH
jgi:hypothetical protein